MHSLRTKPFFNFTITELFLPALPLRYILKDAFINRLRPVAYFRGCISGKR